MEEIDRQMDWQRYLRALDARTAEHIEERRDAMLHGDIKRENISPEEWEAIREHDEIAGEV